jgi:hypothetical protein
MEQRRDKEHPSTLEWLGISIRTFSIVLRNESIWTYRKYAHHFYSWNVANHYYILAEKSRRVSPNSFYLNVAKFFSEWNIMLLGLGGYLARFVYETQLKHIKGDFYSENMDHGPDSEIRKRVLPLLRSFTFGPSENTRNFSTISQISSSFFIQSGPFSIITRNGFEAPSKFVHIPPEMHLFLKHPDNLTLDKDVADIIGPALKGHRIVNNIGIGAFKNHIKQQLLSDAEIEAFVLWLYDNNKRRKAGGDTCRDLLGVIRREGTGRRLSECSFYSTFGHCETFGREDVLSRDLSRRIPSEFLKDNCSWRPFKPLTWLEKVEEEGSWDIFWMHLCRAWRGFSNAEKSQFRETLATKRCLPTRSGLSVPKDTYIPYFSFINSLQSALVTLKAQPENLEEVLAVVGVRTSPEIELKDILSR